MKYLVFVVLLISIFQPLPAAAGLYIRQTESGVLELTDSPSEGAYLLLDLGAISDDLKLPPGARLTGIVEAASKKYGLPESLIYAVIQMESGGDSRALSAAGAAGLMQLMPGTARDMGVKDIYDPRENIFGGSRYLKMMMERFEGDLELALAGYNAGPGNVEKYAGVPPFSETKNFVDKTLAAFEKFRRESDEIFSYRDERGIISITNIH